MRFSDERLLDHFLLWFELARQDLDTNTPSRVDESDTEDKPSKRRNSKQKRVATLYKKRYYTCENNFL